MRHLIQDMLLDKLTRSEAAQNRLPDLEDGVRRGDFTPYAAAAEVLDLLLALGARLVEVLARHLRAHRAHRSV